jgi:hypothetical protein
MRVEDGGPAFRMMRNDAVTGDASLMAPIRREIKR